MNFNPSSYSEMMIELSSKCALSCPRCERTMFPKKFRATELDLELLKLRLTPKWLSQISTFQLNGVYGDPIFHSQFHDAVSFLKSQGSRVTIETGGYGRSVEWWSELKNRLSSTDTITFSIDGLEDTNHLYRKGASWANIMNAVESVRGSSLLVWKFIVFKHNEHQMDAARTMAKSMGFTEFRLVRSNRFGSYWHSEAEDALKPKNEFIGDRLRRIESGVQVPDVIAPRCLESAKLPTISYQGAVFPCCWMVSHYQDEPSFYGGSFADVSLQNHTLEECFQAPVMTRLAESFAQFSCAPKVCQRLCRKADLNLKHSQTQNSDEVFTLATL